jgi:hypothetical protein
VRGRHAGDIVISQITVSGQPLASAMFAEYNRQARCLICDLLKTRTLASLAETTELERIRTC